MSKRVLPIVTVLCCAVAAVFLAAEPQTAPLNPLSDLSTTQQGAEVVIGITGASPISDYTFYDYDPETFVLDLADVDVSLLPKVLSVNQGPVRDVRVESISRAKGRALAKVEIRKAYLAKCLVQSDGNRLFVRVVGAGEGQPAPPAQAAQAAGAPQAPKAKPEVRESASQAKPLPAAKSLTGITVAEDGSHVELRADGQPKFSYFALKNPDRIVVDLQGIGQGKVPAKIPGAGIVQQVRVSAFKINPLVTRVVLDLKGHEDGWSVQNSGQCVRVTMATSQAKSQSETPSAGEPSGAADSVEGGSASPAPEAPMELASAAPPVSEPAPAEASSPEPAREEPAPEVKQQPAPPVAEAPVTAAPERIKVTLAPVEGSVEFKGYESLFVAQDTRSEAAEGKTVVAGGVPLSFRERTITTEQVFTGEPISLSLKDADVKDVLRVFHDISKMNIVVHPSVQGKVTVDLEGVPWDQAMQIILKNNNLDYLLMNNVIWVAPASEIAKKFAEQQRITEEKMKAEDPVTFTMRLSYSDTKKMEAILKKFLSDRGDVISDQRTNTMILREVPSRKDGIVKLIQSLDTPTPQVLIEARIVETNITWSQSFGVVWGGNWFSSVDEWADGGAGPVTSVDVVHPTGIGAGGDGSYRLHGFNNNTSGWPNYGTSDFAVSVPPSATNGFIDLMLGNVSGSFFLDVRLAAMENTGRGRILSAPRVLTQENEKANIEAGTQIPVPIATADRMSVMFINATLKLDVTPHISADGSITMDVDITNDSVDFANWRSGFAPPIIKKAAKTVLKVKDGGTAVIGGVFKTTEGVNQNGLPFFSRIPVLGWLFKNRNKSRVNEELLIFLTPKIVR